MTEKITLGDVAKLADTSVTSVSHLLRVTRYVSPSLRERINSAMDELGVSAADFKSKPRRREHFFSLVIDDIVDPYYASLVKGITVITGSNLSGLNLFTLNLTDNNPVTMRQALEGLSRSESLGVILAPTSDMHGFEPFFASRIPTVLIDRKPPAMPMVSPFIGGVYSDSEIATKEAVLRLAIRGFRRIGLIAKPNDPTMLSGYRSGVEESSIPNSPDLVQVGSSSKDGKLIADNLLGISEPPTAIIAGSYNLTIGVLEALRNSGLHCPEDVAVVGSDYSYPYGEYQRYHMMVVNRPGELIGKTAAKMLISAIEGSQIEEREVSIPSVLVCLLDKISLNPVDFWDQKHII